MEGRFTLRSTSPLPARPAPSGSSSSSARIPSTADNKPGEVCRFSDLAWGVKSLAFSPSGTLLAAGKPDRALRVFDVANQGENAALEKLELLQSIESCIFTPSGTRLLACGRTGHIVVFDVSKDGTLKEVGQFAGHSQDVKCIAVSGDGRYALSGSDEKKARLWEIETGREIAVFAEFGGPVKACHIARSGRTAMATDGALLLDINLGSSPEVKRRRQLTSSWSSGQAAAFSSDGSHVAVGDGYDVKLWNLSTGKEQPAMEAGQIQWSMAFTPDGSRLLTGGTDKVNVWDVREKRRIHSQAIDNGGYIQCLATSPDNKHAAAASRRDVHVFRLPSVR